MVFASFRSENGYRLCPFLSGISYGFRGNYASVLMYLSFQFQRNEKERVICESEFDSDKSFCWSSYLKPNDIISACSRSEYRYGL